MKEALDSGKIPSRDMSSCTSHPPISKDNHPSRVLMSDEELLLVNLFPKAQAPIAGLVL